MSESMLPPRPGHYSTEDLTYEPINVIEAWNLDFSLGNAVKYIARAGRKGDANEDLRKAIWYLSRKIQQNDAIRAYTSCHSSQGSEISQRTDARDCTSEAIQRRNSERIDEIY